MSANYGDGILCMNGSTPSNGENELYCWVVLLRTRTSLLTSTLLIGAVGSVSWWSTLQPPANNYTVVLGPVDWNTRVFLQTYKENSQWVGYSLTILASIWGPDSISASF